MDNQEPQAQQRRNHASEIIVSGHVWSAVWYVAWPTAVNTLIMTAYNVINGIFVGRLHNAEQALAAIGIGGAALMIQFAITMGVSVGTSALVSRFIGGEQYNDADEAAGQSMILSVLAGLISGLPLILFARQIVAGIGAQGPVIPLAADYMAIISYYSVPMFIYFIAQSVLRSTGDAKSPLYAGAATIIINVLLDWVLIFGIGPFPAMGVKGAAISTGISRIAGMIISLIFIRKSILRSSFRHIKPRWDWYARILKIGWPAVIQNLVWTGAQVVFLIILARLGNSAATAAQAALTVALRIESLAFMPGVAYSTAATPLVGQNLGAGKPDRAQHAAWVATGQAVLIMSLVAVSFLAIPKQLAMIFTKEAAVVPLIVSYLRINAIAEPFLALGMVMRGALQGAGDTFIPALISSISLWVLRLPLTYLLAITFSYGATGAWFAMAITTVLTGILTTAWFKGGNWRTIEV